MVVLKLSYFIDGLEANGSFLLQFFKPPSGKQINDPVCRGCSNS